jgi:colanic acid biosynthesis protein WcaH
MSASSWIPEDIFSQIKSLIPIPCVDLLILHNNRLLLMLRNNEPGKDLWFTPGGRVLLGETLEEAVKRVQVKETGLKPLQFEQKGTMSHIWPTEHAITTFYRVEVNDCNITMNEEHRDYRWFSKLPKDSHPNLRGMIERAGMFK